MGSYKYYQSINERDFSANGPQNAGRTSTTLLERPFESKDLGEMG